MLQHKPLLSRPVNLEISKIQLFLSKGFCIQELIFFFLGGISLSKRFQVLSGIHVCRCKLCLQCSWAEEVGLCPGVALLLSETPGQHPRNHNWWSLWSMGKACTAIQFSWLVLQLRRVEIPSTVGAGTKTCDVFETCGWWLIQNFCR